MLRRLLILSFVLALLAGCSGRTPVAVSVPSPTAAPTITETPTFVPPTATNTPRPSPTAMPTSTPTETPTPGAVAAYNIKVHQGPGKNYGEAGHFKKGSKLEVIEQAKGIDGRVWYEVSWVDEDGKEHTGYVRSDVVDANEAAKDVPVVPSDQIPPTPTATATETVRAPEVSISKVEYTVPFNKERREGIAVKTEHTILVTDSEFANKQYKFSLAPNETKNSGEIIMPLDKEGRVLLNQVGPLIHAINLGLIDTDKPLPENWYQKYLEYINSHPNAEYQLQGEVRHGNTNVLETLPGEVDPHKPVKIYILPPLMDKSTAEKRVDRILGGDPRAPFGLPYLNFSAGYSGVMILPDGTLIVAISNFNIKGKLMATRKSLAASDISQSVKIGSNRLERSVLCGYYSRPPAYRDLDHSFYQDPYKGGWKHPHIGFSKP